MTTTEAREIFTQAHAAAVARGDLDGAAKIELAREYFTNPELAKRLADFTWEQTQ